MRIRCTLFEQKGIYDCTIEGTRYSFQGEPGNMTCEVEEERHIARFLGIEGFEPGEGESLPPGLFQQIRSAGESFPPDNVRQINVSKWSADVKAAKEQLEREAKAKRKAEQRKENPAIDLRPVDEVDVAKLTQQELREYGSKMMLINPADRRQIKEYADRELGLKLDGRAQPGAMLKACLQEMQRQQAEYDADEGLEDDGVEDEAGAAA